MRRWIFLAIGLALLAGVIVIGLHFSEADDFVRIAQRARPARLLLAVALQAATYVAQAAIWRVVGWTSGSSKPSGYWPRSARPRSVIRQIPRAGESTKPADFSMLKPQPLRCR